jgi:hypothetical protein
MIATQCNKWLALFRSVWTCQRRRLNVRHGMTAIYAGGGNLPYFPWQKLQRCGLVAALWPHSVGVAGWNGPKCADPCPQVRRISSLEQPTGHRIVLQSPSDTLNPRFLWCAMVVERAPSHVWLPSSKAQDWSDLPSPFRRFVSEEQSSMF